MENTWMEAARHFAAQCWCDEETKNTVMDPALCEAVARRIAIWMDSAASMARNADFYRELLDQCAKHLGPEAYTDDDGSIMEDPVRLKIPELVRKAVKGFTK